MSVAGFDQNHPFTVSQLTYEIIQALKTPFTKIYVEAEISGFKISPSGHAYFSLKDENALLPCVMFAPVLRVYQERTHNGIKDGAKILAFGDITVYPPSGKYQLKVNAVKLAGLGELMQRYLELKQKLQTEGLFAPERKLPLPSLPHHIGLLTSETGAVVHDMCVVLTRRFPNLHITVYPCQVQGEKAPATLIAGLQYFNANPPDLIIVARGGGSYEDLFCFNDEALVRAVAASKVPVISAVGHETDYTLCDFAASKRAGTPSIAAELAVPEEEKLQDRLEVARQRLHGALLGRVDYVTQRVDQLDDSLNSTLQMSYVQAQHQLSQLMLHLGPSLSLSIAQADKRTSGLAQRLAPAMSFALAQSTHRLDQAETRLKLLSPYSVLDRGYSLTTTAEGIVVKDASLVHSGDKLTTRLAHGTVQSIVEASHET